MMLPKLLDSNGVEVRRLDPVALMLDLNFAPVSIATMEVPEAQNPGVGALVEIFTPYGSAGIFRVQQVQEAYSGTVTLNLEHGIVTLSDWLIPGTVDDARNSAREILAALLSNQSTWRLGTVEVPDDEVLTWSYDYSNIMESLVSILDELHDYHLTFDQTSMPWTLNLVRNDDTVRSECRLTRNIASLSVETDRSELCTRLYIPGVADPLDADTISQYGVICRSLTGDDGLSVEEKTEAGRKYIEEHKHPALTVNIDALDLSKETGENLDVYRLGAMCRVCLPEYGQTINQRLITMSWSDMVDDEKKITLTLASNARTNADALAGLIIDTTVMQQQFTKEIRRYDRLTIAASEKLDLISNEIDLIAADVEINAEQIKLYGEHFKTIENELTTVQIDLDAVESTILLKADQKNVDDLATRMSTAEIRLDGVNAEIALKVSQDEVVSAINLSPEGVKISAAKIELDGETIVSMLKGTRIDVSHVDTASLYASEIAIGNSFIESTSLVMGTLVNDTVWGTSGEIDLSHSHKVMVGDDGTVTLGEVSSEGGNFRIADTKTYKEGVSAAYGTGYNTGFDDGKDAYLPTAITRTGYDTAAKTVTVRALNSHQDLLTGQVIGATEIYDAGWNECRDNAVSWRVLVNYYSAGETLYDKDGNVATGPWYKGTEAYRYELPAKK